MGLDALPTPVWIRPLLFTFSSAPVLVYAIFLHLTHMGKRMVSLRLGDRRIKQDVFIKG